MSEIVERVAKVLAAKANSRSLTPEGEWHGKSQQALWHGIARAAIEAMRAPTNEMCEAGAKYYHDNYSVGQAKDQTSAPLVWREMIDAALKTKA